MHATWSQVRAICEWKKSFNTFRFKGSKCIEDICKANESSLLAIFVNTAKLWPCTVYDAILTLHYTILFHTDGFFFFYLLVVTALSDELRSREPPGEESQRTETLVRHRTRHVERLRNGAVWKRSAARAWGEDNTSLSREGLKSSRLRNDKKCQWRLNLFLGIYWWL